MTFVGTFVEYMKSRTDAPVDFHLHGAMVALAAALGNRIWCDGWTGPVYPNLWVVNIAPSGYGKSTTLDMAKSLLQKAGLGDAVLPSAFSQEALVRRLSTDPNGVWFHQEFSAFMGTLSRDYNAGSMQTITELYDVPDEYTRILGVTSPQSFVLRRPCISMLGATSPSWFAQVFHESALSGGFLARFLFCPSAEAGDYVGHPGPRDEGVEAILSGHLREVAQLRGKVDLRGILPAFREWDYVARERVRHDCPPEFSGMRSRSGTLVLKAALLFHVARDYGEMRLDEIDLRNAIRYVESSQTKAERYLDEEVAHDKKELQRMRIVAILRRATGGSRTWSETLKLSKLDRFEFRSAIETLTDSGIVRLSVEGKAQRLTLISPIPRFTSELQGTGESGKNGVSRLVPVAR